jgi:hypothetical protein
MSYVEEAATARELIGEAGTKTLLRRTTPGAYDPVTGVISPPVVETQEVVVVTLPVVPSRDDSFEAATFKRTYQRHLYVALKVGAPWEPVQGDEIFIEGQWWVIPGGSMLRPDGGVPVLFETVVERR